MSVRSTLPNVVTLALLVCLLAFGKQSFAQRDLKNIPTPNPDEELLQFEVPDGFEVNLYAADPLLANPIQMNFDQQGRLWVASSAVYPQIEPGQAANDKVLVIEDTNADGVADKTTVFADGLLIPTGVLPGDGGCYIANSTELLHLADVDHDLRADRERVVLSGFGTEDTHHILHTLRWGPDGALYMNQSIYIHSHIETPYGVRRMNGSGVWRFQPDSMQLEVFTLGLVNPWGHAWDRYGTSFETDGAGGEGINYVFPGFVGMTSPGAARIMSGLNPGKPKLCGLEIVGGSHLPDDWQGDLITNDFRAHRVCRYKVEREGSGFRSQELGELIKTPHVAFRPIDVKMGPDGAIYVADWYNPIIQHGEVDFRDERRDHVHGRIWRVTAKDRPLVPRVDLTKLSVEQLVTTTSSVEPWQRHHARLVIRDRAKQQGTNGVLVELNHQLAELNLADVTSEQRGLDLLWTYQAIDHCPASLIKRLLVAKDPRVRAAAVRAVYHFHDRLPQSMIWMSERVVDPDGQVRLEAVRTLSRLSQPDACPIAMRALDLPVDRFLDFALWSAARELQTSWLPALKAGELDFGGRSDHLAFALQAVQSGDVAPLLISLLDNIKTDSLKNSGQSDLRNTVLAVLGRVGDADQLGRVWREIEQLEDGSQRAVALAELVASSRQRRLRPAGDVSKLLGWLNEGAQASLRSTAIEAAGVWNVAESHSQLAAIASDANEASETRNLAIDAASQLASPESISLLQRLCDTDDSPAIKLRAAAGLVRRDLQVGIERLASVLSQLPSDVDPAFAIETCLRQKDGANLLASRLAAYSIPRDVAMRAVRTVQSSGRNEATLVASLSRAGQLQKSPWQMDADAVAQLLSDAETDGIAAKGELVYRREELACQKCHAIGGAGAQVGPDLVSIGGSAQPDYLLESLLQPGKKIKENYHSLIVETDEGQVVTGIKVRETQTELILRSAENQQVRVPLASIEERVDGGSLMPAGLVDGLTRSELVHLVRFLSDLGQVGAGFTLPQENYVRHWQVLQAGESNTVALRGNGLQRAATHVDELVWQPAFSRVAGDLPLSELPHITVGPDQRVSIVRAEFEIPASGKLTAQINLQEDVQIWFDDTRIELTEVMQLVGKPGMHSVTLVIARPTRQLSAEEAASGESLRIEFVE